jgi:hypothetical protein
MDRRRLEAAISRFTRTRLVYTFKGHRMETRELYKQKYEAQMHKWTAKLHGLHAETELMTAQAKLDVKPHVDALQAKFDAATAKLGEIATVTDEKWDGLAKEVDGAWTDLKAAAGGAYDAMKRHKAK